jgi:molybdenum cofactor cytidylyltransferase
MRLAAVILAAGYSSRMGAFKPLLTLGDRTLLGHCALLLRHPRITTAMVVTGHRHREVEAEAHRLGLACLHNPGYDRGMFSSIQAALPFVDGFDGFFLLPVDIPLVRSATIDALATAFDGKSVVVPGFRGLSGHPPLLPASLIPTIAGDDGRGGLRRLLDSLPPATLRTLPFWDRGVLLDADTPEDLAVLATRLARLPFGEREEVHELARLNLPEVGLAHGLAVAGVAERIGRELRRHGVQLDHDLLYHGALLHDFAKGMPNHEETGAARLVDLGLGGLAETVAAHRQAEPPALGTLGEKEVVALADKLVRGRFHVSVRQRFLEKLELFRDDPEACRAINRRMANALTLLAMVEKVCGKGIDAILGEEGLP